VSKTSLGDICIPIGSMYAIYGNIYHKYTPHVSIYSIHGSYGICHVCPYPAETPMILVTQDPRDFMVMVTLWLLPSGKLTCWPWIHSLVLMETNLPTPFFARVYVNLPEGNVNLYVCFPIISTLHHHFA
jgi:hypothetical protein